MLLMASRQLRSNLCIRAANVNISSTPTNQYKMTPNQMEAAMTDYIEVDLYICGVYRGRRKIGKDGLYGQLLSGDFSGASDSLADMQSELEQLGCTVDTSMEMVEAANGGDNV